MFQGNRSIFTRTKDSLLESLGYNRGSYGVPREPGDRQPLTVEEQEVKKSWDLYGEYRGLQADWALNFVEAVKFRNGDQWSDDQRKELAARKMSPLVVNRMHPIIEAAKSLLTYNPPRFSSTAREDSDRATGKVFADLFAWVWDVSCANAELKIAIDDYYVGGMGILQVYQDPNADMGKGEVLVKSLYPLDVLFDPNSRDIYARDAAYIVVSQLLTDEQSLRMFPDFIERIKEAESNDADEYPSSNLMNPDKHMYLGEYQDAHHKRKRFIERYSKVKVSLSHIFEPDSGREFMLDTKELVEYRKQPAILVMSADGSERVATQPAELAQLYPLIEQTGGVFHLMPGEPVQTETGEVVEGEPQMMPGEEHEGAIPQSTVYMVETTTGEMIQSDRIILNEVKVDRVKLVVTVGKRLLYSRLLPCSEYPIVPLMNVHNRTPYPESDVRIYKPMQQYINKIRSLIIAHATTSTSTKLLLPRGAAQRGKLEEQWGRAGTTVIEFDAEVGTPIVAGPVPLPTELYKNEADAKYDLEYGFGIFELMQGSTKDSPTTYRGTVAIDEYGQRRIKSRRDDIEGAINQLAKAAVPLMQQIYTHEKVVRLIQPNNTVKETQLNFNTYDEFTGEELGKLHDITAGKYDVIMVSGSSLPSNRWALFEYYKELYEAGAIDQVELLKKSEIVDVEGVLERFSYIKQLEGAIQQAQEEIKNLSGDLQTAERSEVNMRKRLEVEKFSTELDKEKNKLSSASNLFSLRLEDMRRNLESAVKPTSNTAGKS